MMTTYQTPDIIGNPQCEWDPAYADLTILCAGIGSYVKTFRVIIAASPQLKQLVDQAIKTPTGEWQTSVNESGVAMLYMVKYLHGHTIAPIDGEWERVVTAANAWGLTSLVDNLCDGTKKVGVENIVKVVSESNVPQAAALLYRLPPDEVDRALKSQQRDAFLRIRKCAQSAGVRDAVILDRDIAYSVIYRGPSRLIKASLQDLDLTTFTLEELRKVRAEPRFPHSFTHFIDCLIGMHERAVGTPQ
jgi:hypothetical protein